VNPADTAGAGRQDAASPGYGPTRQEVTTGQTVVLPQPQRPQDVSATKDTEIPRKPNNAESERVATVTGLVMVVCGNACSGRDR